MLLAVQRHLTVVQDENGDRWVRHGLLHSERCLDMRKRNRPDAHWEPGRLWGASSESPAVWRLPLQDVSDVMMFQISL